MDRRERHYQDAVRFHRSLDPGVLRMTTWGIVSETYTWLRYHAGFYPAERWLNEEAALESQGSLEVTYPTPAMTAGTRRILARFSDQDLSYVDAFSLYVVQVREIDAIFAFDHHLALVGVPVLPGPVD
jgi:predicted nucleic acid-binding protein